MIINKCDIFENQFWRKFRPTICQKTITCTTYLQPGRVRQARLCDRRDLPLRTAQRTSRRCAYRCASEMRLQMFFWGTFNRCASEGPLGSDFKTFTLVDHLRNHLMTEPQRNSSNWKNLTSTWSNCSCGELEIRGNECRSTVPREKKPRSTVLRVGWDRATFFIGSLTTVHRCSWKYRSCGDRVLAA